LIIPDPIAQDAKQNRKTECRYPDANLTAKLRIYTLQLTVERISAALSIGLAGEWDFRDFSRLPPVKENR
jgi:hypothetical protein